MTSKSTQPLLPGKSIASLYANEDDLPLFAVNPSTEADINLYYDFRSCASIHSILFVSIIITRKHNGIS